MSFEFSTGVTICIYCILILVCFYAYKMETKDLSCPSTKSTHRQCGPGRGTAYFRGRPNSNDSTKVLLDKIMLSSTYESNSVKWRRCLIFSVLITIIGFLLVFSRLPTGQEMLIFVLCVYFGLYLILIYYQKSVAAPAVKQIDSTIRILRERFSVDLISQ